MAKYIKVLEKKKPGPKKGAVYIPLKERVAKRMQKFNGSPIVSPSTKTDREFNTKVQEIINNQLTRLHTKSATSNLDITETKILLDLAKMNMILAGNTEQDNPDINEDIVKQAMDVMKELNGQSTEDPKTTKE